MISFQSFYDEFTKIAATQAQKADSHHKAEVKDWKLFEKNLTGATFQKSLLKHPNSDEKLKTYVKNYGGYIRSKDLVGRIPSRTSDKVYDIKKLPNGKLGCGCKDWQFIHSIKGTDCDHIAELKRKDKTSSVIPDIMRGATIVHKLRGAKEELNKGRRGEAAGGYHPSTGDVVIGKLMGAI